MFMFLFTVFIVYNEACELSHGTWYTTKKKTQKSVIGESWYKKKQNLGKRQQKQKGQVQHWKGSFVKKKTLTFSKVQAWLYFSVKNPIQTEKGSKWELFLTKKSF